MAAAVIINAQKNQKRYDDDHLHETASQQEKRRKREERRKKRAQENAEDGDADALAADRERRRREKEKKGGRRDKDDDKDARRKKREKDRPGESDELKVQALSSERSSPDELKTRVASAKEQGLEFISKFNNADVESIEQEDVDALLQVLGEKQEPAEEGEEGEYLIRLAFFQLMLMDPDMGLLDEPLTEEEAAAWFGPLMQGEEGEEMDPEEILVGAAHIHYYMVQDDVLNKSRMRGNAEGHEVTASEINRQEEAELQRQREEEEREKAALAAEISKIEVTRADLVQHVIYTVARDDAFMTLPQTLIYIVVFTVLVTAHLSIYKRQLMEKSLEDWLNGRDPFTSADKNIDDLDSWWEWALGVGVPAPLEMPKKTGANFTKYFLASRHILIGDVRMQYTTFDGTEKTAWLLNSDLAQKHLKTKPDAYLEAATLAATDLKDNQGWDSPDIENLWLSFITYDELAEAYCITSAWTWIDAFGQATPVMNSDAVFVNPYGDASRSDDGTAMMWCIITIIFDAVFFIMVMNMLISEGKDAFASLRLGCDEFFDYLQVWNIVDWVSILLSLLVMVLWVACVAGTGDPKLKDIINEDGLLGSDPMKLDAETLDGIFARVQSLRNNYTGLQVAMALNTCSIVMKFFKAFQSNPRLKVVTDTFKQAATDLAHFFIIFLTLFLPFTVIGHILFGNDIPELGSFISSMSTGVSLLMGDFGWYVDVAPEYWGARLPSGMPAMVLFLWFFFFNFMMVLVVLNMLLAVVLEHYTNITNQLKDEVDAPPIWVQVHRYITFMKQTRGFVKLEHMGRLLENDDEPAHPKEWGLVTGESLSKAFEGMSEAQATWMMQFLQTKNFQRQQVEANHEGHCNHQGQILEVVQENSDRLAEIQSKVSAPNPDLMSKLDLLIKSMNDLKSEQADIRKHMEKATGAAKTSGNGNHGVLSHSTAHHSHGVNGHSHAHNGHGNQDEEEKLTEEPSEEASKEEDGQRRRDDRRGGGRGGDKSQEVDKRDKDDRRRRDDRDRDRDRDRKK